MFFVILSIVGVVGITGLGVLNLPQFGKIPSGERLERIQKSPHYQNGHFVNEHETPTMTGDKNFASSLFDFFFKKYPNAVPDSGEIPVVKTDLAKLDRKENIIVWFGHSSYLVQAAGKRFLIDPVFHAGAPFEFIDRPFPGTDIYTPEDMPDFDILIITHDHYDHLDYKTVKPLEPRVPRVVTGLGVGSHLEYWGYPKEKISELDWGESLDLGNGFKIHCFPTRHFSGRSVFQNRTLWASFVIETPEGNIYVGGDSGYDTHFAKIGEKFPGIDFAILENGQYNKDWAKIHTLPDELPKVAHDLNAKRYMTVHNSKFKLSTHDWNEPLKNAQALREKGFDVLTPKIGEPARWKP